MSIVAYVRLNKIHNMFTEHPRLEFKEYILRRLEIKDACDVMEIYSNEDIKRYDRLPIIRNIKGAKKTIEELSEKYYSGERIDWAIEHRQTGKVIGLFALHNISIVDSKSDIGYILNKSFTNSGIMTEVVSLMVKYLFNEIGMHKLNATININNTASIKVCESANFKIEGYSSGAWFNTVDGDFVDCYIYSIINEQWKFIIEK